MPHVHFSLPFTAGEQKLTQSFFLTQETAPTPDCSLLRVCSRAENGVPHISFQYLLKEQEQPLYHSHAYRLGASKFLQQTWRLPPIPTDAISLCVHIEVPEGATVYLKAVEISPAPTAPRHYEGARFNAHLGFIGMSPSNTLSAFRLAAACGFGACIAVPKVTKDGVLVCLHDATINREARNPDGSRVGEEPIHLAGLSYNQLLRYDIGIRKGRLYAGSKIACVEDFFAICAETGMDPMFSTHPALPLEKWREVREMLQRHGLLRGFHVKAPEIETLCDAYRVFGTEIDGYTLDVQRLGADTTAKMLASGIDRTACRVGIEVRCKHLSQEDVRAIRAAGFFAAAWDLPRCRFDEVYETLLSWGVSELTEDRHCSMGLDF